MLMLLLTFFFRVELQWEKKQMTLMAHFSILRPCTSLPRNRMYYIGPGCHMESVFTYEEYD